MEFTKLGSTGTIVSRLALGCMTYGEPSLGRQPWSLSENESRPLIRHALERGINFFDTANTYSAGSSEEILGAALREFTRREEVVIATKIWGEVRPDPNGRGLSRKAIMVEIDNSLRRLGTDYVDLYQVHRWDPTTRIDETMEALHDIVRAGKALYVGASNMAAWQFSKAIYIARAHGWTPFVSMQGHYNLLYREEEREMHPLCADVGAAVLPWSPLARGRLARPWGTETTRSTNDPRSRAIYGARVADATIVERVGTIATDRACTHAQIALAWLLRQPVVTAPIIGARTTQQLEEAVAAVNTSLTDDETAFLEAAYEPRPMLALA
jgi:aryl-alcohol dehydrogenase (NADP+)